jgi:hypothetical protein
MMTVGSVKGTGPMWIVGEAGLIVGEATIFQGSGCSWGWEDVEAMGEGLHCHLEIQTFGSVDGFSGSFSRTRRIRKFLLSLERLGWLTFDDNDLFFRGIVILILIAIIEPSLFWRATMCKFLVSPRDSVPVTALASIVARTASFGVDLWVTIWFGAEWTVVALRGC